MIDEIKKKIDDPYEVESQAPLGFEFLMAAALGPHNLRFSLNQQEFLRRAKILQRESFGDYNTLVPRSVPLSNDAIEFNDSLSQALFNRRSNRDFKGGETTFAQVSFILKLAAGLKRKEEMNRFYPSGGGLYTVRLYLYARNITGLPHGVYLFNPFKETLDLVNDKFNKEDVTQLHNNSLESESKANFEFWLTTRPSVALKKYLEHGWKIILMEMGHLAQNLWLVSTACQQIMYPCSNINLAKSEKLLRTDVKGELLLYSLVGGV